MPKAALRILFIGMLMAFMPSCSTSSSDDPDHLGDDNGEPDDGIGGNVDRRSFTSSLSNNPLTSRTISPSAARSVASRLAESVAGFSKGASKKSSRDDDDSNSGTSETSVANIRAQYLAVFAAQRLGEVPIETMMRMARSAAQTLEARAAVGNTPDRNIGDAAKLELGLAALRQRRFGLAAFFLDEGVASKNRRVKAGALNGLGLLALGEGRVPEAVTHWKDALKAVPNYEASVLNLAFVSLKFGAIEEAGRYLARITGDWFVEYGQQVTSRLSGNLGEATSLCSKLSDQFKSHRAIAFNCGVHEWQSNNNVSGARKLMSAALAMKGGSPEWERSGQKSLETLLLAQAEQERELKAVAAEKARRAKAAKEAEDKRKAPPVKGPPKPAPKGADSGGASGPAGGAAPPL